MFKVGDVVRKKDGSNFCSGGQTATIVEWDFSFPQPHDGFALSIKSWVRGEEIEIVEPWSEWLALGEAVTSFLGKGVLCHYGDFKSRFIKGKEEYSFPMSRKAKPVVKQVCLKINHEKSCSYNPYINKEMSNPTHHLIYNLIDGEIDCSSVKMEKL